MAGQFDIIYSQKTPSGQIGNALMGNLPSTGAGDIGRAASGFGGAMFEVGQKIQVAQDAMDLSLLNRQGEEMDLAAEQQLMKITDADEQEKFIQAHEEKRGAIAGKSNGRIQNAYQMNYNNTTADRQRRFASVGLQARAKDAEDKGRFAYDAAINSGNEFEARKINALRLATETIGQAEYDSLEASLPVDIKFAQAIKMGDVDLNKAEAMVSGMKDLTAEQTIKKDNILTHFNALRNRSNSALRAQQEKETFDLYGKSEEGTLTWDDLKTSVIPADEKQEIWRNFKAVQYAKANGEISAIEEGDPTVLAQVNEIVDLRPDLLQPSQIYAMTKNGLGTKYATGLVDRLNRNKTEKNPIASKYRAELGRLQSAELFGKKGKPKTSDAYMGLSVKLDTFLATNPTDEQTQKFFSSLIREKVKSGSIASIFNTLEIAGKYGLTGPIPALIYNLMGTTKEREAQAAQKTMTPPAEYPDATWDTQNNMWVVVRDGRKMGVQ
ncbi:MAG: hypothetical protein IMZ61_06525 [Planctomycetes bacterium]|nr:hypothetical protein [Planctomycetota bacterium]